MIGDPTAIRICKNITRPTTKLDVIKKGDVLVISTGWDDSGAVVGDHWAAVAKKSCGCRDHRWPGA